MKYLKHLLGWGLLVALVLVTGCSSVVEKAKGAYLVNSDQRYLVSVYPEVVTTVFTYEEKFTSAERVVMFDALQNWNELRNSILDLDVNSVDDYNKLRKSYDRSSQSFIDVRKISIDMIEQGKVDQVTITQLKNINMRVMRLDKNLQVAFEVGDNPSVQTKVEVAQTLVELIRVSLSLVAAVKAVS
jgi:hypothetical protein